MDPRVSIAIGDKDVAVWSDGGFGWSVERLSQARDAASDLAVIAGVGGDTRCAQGHQQRAVGRELAHGVVAVVDGVDEIILVYGQRVNALGEQIFSKRADECSVWLVDDAAGIATSQHEDAIPGIHGDPDHIAVPVSRRNAFPL